MKSLLIAVLIVMLIGRAPAQEDASRPSGVLILGGTVIDGTGAKGRRADVRIVGDTIREIGALTPAPGEHVIDAAGMVVTPGFIDTHSHVDIGIFDSPLAETHVRQGITTSVVGQDGGSRFPLAAFFRDLEAKHVALNIASFVGHGTVRTAVTGSNFKRRVTPEQLEKMCGLVDREMQAGALGLSSGLEYDPGYYSDTPELIALARVAGKRGGIYISHVRDEGNEALTSFRELIRIAREGRLPAQISHIKLATAAVWGKAREVLRMMADARKQGLDITADVYPYLYWQSTITVLTLDRHWENRAVWAKALIDVGGPDHVLLTTYSADKTWTGKTITQISAMTGKDPISVVQEIVRRTHSPGTIGVESVVVTAMQEDDLRRFIADPYVMFCTDGMLNGTHPRGAGSFPRVLGRYVREQRVLTLEAAVRKMTSLPADRMGFHDRGRIKVGMKADIVVFDPRTVIDTATTSKPTSPPMGILTVLVNGVSVLEAGRMTGARPGVVLRHIPSTQ